MPYMSRSRTIRVLFVLLATILAGLTTGQTARAATDPSAAAVAWAKGKLGTPAYNGLCPTFPLQRPTPRRESILARLKALPNTELNPKSYAQHPGDMAPPVGALVF